MLLDELLKLPVRLFIEVELIAGSTASPHVVALLDYANDNRISRLEGNCISDVDRQSFCFVQKSF